ncbi:MAG: transcription elongation factor GreA [Legionellales bacterium]|nr:transcription elongation factor GreA [Legionellales bacterium]|tara:strand:- start:992 stop:1474 length:483 start_codon:yes stop_codon:yes gene_type:complete
MTGKKIPMTVTGHQVLVDELDNLKRVVRKEVIAAIAEARAHGDLKENAEYHAAKERQSFVEGRIAELESKLSLAQVIDVSKIPHTGRVVFGVTVELINIDNDETSSYQIVGEEEANLKQRKISVTSPIARALIGKDEGDIVDITTPGGLVSYEITHVKHT